MKKLKAVFVNRPVLDCDMQRLQQDMPARHADMHRSLLCNLQNWKQQQPEGVVILKMKCKDYHPHLLVS